MKNNLEIIGIAVVTGLLIPNKFGAGSFTPSDLMGLSNDTIDTLYQTQKKLASAEDSESLFKEKKGSTLAKKRVELLEAIAGEKQRIANEATLADKLKKEKVAKLSLLKSAKTAKEIATINAKSIEELEAEIAALEA